MKDTQIIKQEAQVAPAIVMPAVNAKQAIEAWNQYLELKKAIVDPKTDIQVIQGKDFLKKSYWRKVSTFFNLTVKKIDESHETIGKTVVWNFTVEAIAPNGRSAVGTGSCDAFEKATLVNGKYMQKGDVREWGRTPEGKSYPKEFEWKEATPNSLHNIRSTAETRATNRAISNLVGGGEVSSDEIVITEENHQHAESQTQTTQSQPVDTKHFCTIHNKPMKQRGAKNGGHYYDHRWTNELGEWQKCNSLPKKEKDTFEAANQDSMPLDEAFEDERLDLDEIEQGINEGKVV